MIPGFVNGVQQAFNDIMGWSSANAEHFTFVQVPKGQTDVEYDDSPLVPYQDYFRIWLHEMYLTKSRAWFIDHWPAVETGVKLLMAGQDGPVSVSRLRRVPEGAIGKGEYCDYAVTDLLPYGGGLVEVGGGLFVVKGRNYLHSALKVLEDFSQLVTPPLSQALAVADKVSSGMQELVRGAEGEVYLGLHTTFASVGGGGSNVLAPGYLALILAPVDEIDISKISIAKNRLHYEGARLEAHDYLLYRIEKRAERDDWLLPQMRQALEQAHTAYAQGKVEEGRAKEIVARTEAVTSPFLALKEHARINNEITNYLKDAKGEPGGPQPTAEQREVSFGEILEKAH
jgi:hypothetical protein